MPLACGAQFTAISRIGINGLENVFCFTSQGSGRNSFWRAGYLPLLNKIITWFEVFILRPLPWLEEMGWLRAIPAAALGGGSIHTELFAVVRFPPPFLLPNGEVTAVNYEII